MSGLAEYKTLVPQSDIDEIRLGRMAEVAEACRLAIDVEALRRLNIELVEYILNQATSESHRGALEFWIEQRRTSVVLEVANEIL